MKFKTHIPNRLPLRTFTWEAFVDLLGKAHEVIARYDEVVNRVESPEKVFSLFTSEEAIASLQSQKVHVTLEELFLYQSLGLKVTREQELGMVKIQNYRSALEKAAKVISTRPISLGLLCKIHAMIKKDDKGPRKEIGGFRERQNWIGAEGCSITEAYFYPPRVSILKRCLHNLKQYLSYEEKDLLVQLAIFFAQLLIIHPFMDGNGRVGRLLIPLFLYKKQLTATPLFYLSAYFKRHRLKYFEKLFAITSKNDWEDWIQFFLRGIIEEGERNIKKAKLILSLYQRFNEEVGHSKRARDGIDALFASPIMKKEKWSKLIKRAAELKALEEKKWIVPYKGKSMVAVKALLTIDQIDKYA